jgi:hypothetical protein
MYNSKSINDGVEFINQSNTRISKTCNKIKKNKYKTESQNGLVLETDIIEGFDIDDKALNDKNALQTSEMNTNISEYTSKINDLQTSVNDITTQSKTFLDSNGFLDLNGQSALKNKDIQISGGAYGRVNNAGIFKPYPSSGEMCKIPQTPVTTGINISSASRTVMNPYPLLSDSTNSGNVALYGSPMAKGPNNTYPCSNFAGTNIYVSQSINFSYTNDMVYNGAFLNNNSSPALSQQTDMTGVTVKQCVTRAMDKGFNVAALNNYNTSTKKGDCWIGNGTVMNGNVQNHFKVITHLDSIFTGAGGRANVTFAADGGIYAGSSSSKFDASIMPSGSAVPISDLHPLYGGTISYLTASYAFDRGWSNWNDLLRFNYDPIGSPGGRMESAKQNIYWKPVLRPYTYTDYYGRNVTYNQWTWEAETVTSTVAPQATGAVYINYTCGKINKPPTFQSSVPIGSGFNIDCWDLYSKYPSFSLYLSDDGIITIVNNSGDRTTGGLKWTSSNAAISVPLLTLSNGRQINPRAPRSDWVSGSINGGSGLLSYSTVTPTLTNGQWISSPNGLCRLRFDQNSGKLILEYSLYDVALDSNNDLIGVGGGFSKYSLTKVDDPNVKGKVAYIDIDNSLHQYADANMLGFDSEYTPMLGFLPSTTASKIYSGALPAEANCATKCNDTPTCTGYTYINGTCNTYTDSQIYPKGDRIMMLQSDGKTLDTAVKTQLRNRKIEESHYSCNKVVNNVDSSIYNSHPVTSNMTKDQKCALGLILDAQMANLDVKKNTAIAGGNIIKGKITDIYNAQNNLKNKIEKKSSKIVSKLAKQEIQKKKIDKYVDANNTSTATVTDTELLLISDNYKYVLWGIITIILSMTAIKTFRNASL